MRPCNSHARRRHSQLCDSCRAGNAVRELQRAFKYERPPRVLYRVGIERLHIALSESDNKPLRTGRTARGSGSSSLRPSFFRAEVRPILPDHRRYTSRALSSSMRRSDGSSGSGIGSAARISATAFSRRPITDSSCARPLVTVPGRTSKSAVITPPIVT